MSKLSAVVLAVGALALNANANNLVKEPTVCANGGRQPRGSTNQVDIFGQLMGDRPAGYSDAPAKCHVCGDDCHNKGTVRNPAPRTIEFRYGMIGRNDNNAGTDNCPSGAYPQFNSLIINGKTYEVDALDDANNIVRVPRVGNFIEMKYFDTNGDYQTCMLADTSCYDEPIYVGNQYGPMTMVQAWDRYNDKICKKSYPEPECECDYCPCPPPPPAPPVPFAEIFTAELTPIGASTAKGAVSIRVDKSGGVFGHGYATGLESSVLAFAGDCDAKNGCGVHIHSGFGCENSAAQGGHFFDQKIEDPWAFVNYGSTNPNGSSLYDFSLNIGRTDVEGRAFVIHGTDGTRIACGTLVRRHTSDLVEA